MVVRTDSTAFSTIHSYFAFDHARLDAALAELAGQVDRGDIHRAMRDFAQFERGMKRHLHIEEDVLFQLYAFDRTGYSKVPTQTLQSDHVRIVEAIEEMGEALGAHDVFAFRAALIKLNAILPEHNAKEEHVLYPLVDSLLGAAEAERL